MLYGRICVPSVPPTPYYHVGNSAVWEYNTQRLAQVTLLQGFVVFKESTSSGTCWVLQLWCNHPSVPTGF